MTNEEFLISVYEPAYARLLELGKNKEDAEKYARYIAVQAAHESGWGAKVTGKNNFFGMKATVDQQGTYATTHEGYGANRTQIVDKFLDYDTPEQGVRAAVDRLSSRFHAFDGSASPEGFVDSIKKHGYFTDNRDNYLRDIKRTLEGPTVRRAFAGYVPKVQKRLNMPEMPSFELPPDNTRVVKPLLPPLYEFGGRVITVEMLKKTKELIERSTR